MNVVAPQGPPNPRFFHMPRFQGHHGQYNKQQNYMHQYRQHMLANQNVTFDGKHLRKAVLRKTVDYNTSIITYLKNRVWQRDHRDMRAIQADELYQSEVVPPSSMIQNPMNCVNTKFVRTSTNKLRCPIFCVCWTPEGRRLITGASSGEFTLWNGLTFNFETILQAHDTSVRTMVWSHNDMWMVTADHAGFVKYWQSNMNNVKMFQAHKEPIRGISFCPTDQKFASCSDDGTVRVWDFLHCTEERILRGHGADVKCVDWHPQKSLVASGSKDTQQPVKLWDPKAGANLATIHAHKHTVMELKWNKNGNWLLTASRDHLIKIFDIRNLKEEMQTFKGHKKEATALAWHPVHESLFASGGSEGSLMFWTVGTDKEVGAMDEAHEGMVWSMAWHPLGHILVSGSNDHTTKFWSRNKPGDSMRDRYNLNLLPMGQSEDTAADFENEHTGSHIPGMGLEFGLPEHLKQEKKEEQTPAPPVIPGLDFSSGSHPVHDRPIPRKKVPYSKPIPKQFEQAWEEGKQPALLGDASSIIRNQGPGGGPSMNGPRGLLQTPPRGPGPNMQGPRPGGPNMLGGPPRMPNHQQQQQMQRMPPPMQQMMQQNPQMQQQMQQNKQMQQQMQQNPQMQQQGFRPGGPQFQGQNQMMQPQRFQQIPQGTNSPQNANQQMNQVRGQFPNQSPHQNMGQQGPRQQFPGQGYQGQRFQGPNQRQGDGQDNKNMYQDNVEQGLRELREKTPTQSKKGDGFEDNSRWHQQMQQNNNHNMDFRGNQQQDFRNNEHRMDYGNDRRPPMQGQNRHSISGDDGPMHRNNFNEGPRTGQENNFSSNNENSRGRGMSHRGGRGRGGSNNQNSNFGESHPPSLLDMPAIAPPQPRKRPWDEGPGDEQGDDFGGSFGENQGDDRAQRGGRGGMRGGGMMSRGGSQGFRGGGGMGGNMSRGGMQRGRGGNQGWRGGGRGNRGR